MSAAAALELARQGFAVHPLHHPVIGGCSCRDPECKKKKYGKHPLHTDWPKESTSDPAEVAELFKGHPRANVGINTEKSRKIVLDVDTRSDGHRSYEELLAELGPLPLTPTAITSCDDHGRWSKHYYFEASAEPVPSSTGKIGDGLDVKAVGGQVVGVGSMHAGGAPYAWAPGLSPDDVPFAELPTAWAEWCRKAAEKPEIPKWEPPAGWIAGVGLSDDVLRAKMFANKKDGAKLRDLSEGRWQQHYKSQSEADIKYVGRSAWWTNGDFGRAERWLIDSGLNRPKWKGTYRKSTLNRVRDGFRGGYTGKRPEPEPEPNPEPQGTGNDCQDEVLRLRALLDQKDAEIAAKDRKIADLERTDATQKARIRLLEVETTSFRANQEAEQEALADPETRTLAKALYCVGKVLVTKAPYEDGLYGEIRERIGRPRGIPKGTMSTQLTKLENYGVIERGEPHAVHWPQRINEDTGEVLSDAIDYMEATFKPTFAVASIPDFIRKSKTIIKQKNAEIRAAGEIVPERGANSYRCKNCGGRRAVEETIRRRTCASCGGVEEKIILTITLDGEGGGSRNESMGAEGAADGPVPDRSFCSRNESMGSAPKGGSRNGSRSEWLNTLRNAGAGTTPAARTAAKRWQQPKPSLLGYTPLAPDERLKCDWCQDPAGWRDAKDVIWCEQCRLEESGEAPRAYAATGGGG